MSAPMRDDKKELIMKRLPALWANTEITVSAIGERFGTSTNSITNLAKEMGLGEKPKVRMVRQKRLPTHRQGWKS